MSRIAPALLLLACLAATASAEPIELPPKVEAEPGRLIQIAAKGGEESTLLWDIPDGLEYAEFGRRICLVALAPGRYTIKAFGLDGQKPTLAKCVVIVGVKPPEPRPPEPKPIDSKLGAILRESLAVDGGLTDSNRKHLLQLAELYRQGKSCAIDTDYRTFGALLGVLRIAAGNLLPADALPTVRGAVGRAINESFKVAPSTALEPADRERFAALFGTIEIEIRRLAQ